MERAVTAFEQLLELNKNVKISALEKVLFCVYRGVCTPKELMDKLNVSKGNLANYCKHLASTNKLKKQRNENERGVTYIITEKGTLSVQKILKDIDNHISNNRK